MGNFCSGGRGAETTDILETGGGGRGGRRGLEGPGGGGGCETPTTC